LDSTIIINLILVAIFIGLTAFFVGAEFAILKVRGSKLDQLIAEGNKKAVMAKKVTEQLDFYLSACQLGITITALVRVPSVNLPWKNCFIRCSKVSI